MGTVRELGPQALVKSFFGPLEDKGDIPPKHLESGRADGYEKCLRRRATFGEVSKTLFDEVSPGQGCNHDAS